jgi:DNA-directed RNA polymerase subunit H (RpoH/RPB5)
MNYEIVDVLYRSRITLLEHLSQSGYDTTPYSKFSPKEVAEMIKAGPIAGAPPALAMELTKKEDGAALRDGSPKAALTPYAKCIVVYTIGKIKQKLAAFTKKLIDPEEAGFDSKSTELIIVTLEPIAPNFHAMAYECWMKNDNTKVRYFQAASLVNNPLQHILVPKHEKVPAEEEEALLKGMYATKAQLPLIRFHEDPIARMLGLVPKDIVRITRPSLTAGENIGYRLCVP